VGLAKIVKGSKKITGIVYFLIISTQYLKEIEKLRMENYQKKQKIQEKDKQINEIK
jgi:hypothetical protein